MAKKKTTKKAKKPKAVGTASLETGVLTMDGVKIHCVHDELVEIDRMMPNPRNPNTHPDKQVEKLAKLIKVHGWRLGITVSKRSGFIVSGHCRLLAAKMLGLTVVPVDYQEFDNEAAEWAVLISDNVIAEFNVINGLAMAELINELDTVNYPLELTALEPEQIEDYIVGPTGDPGGTEEPNGSGAKEITCPECGHVFKK